MFPDLLLGSRAIADYIGVSRTTLWRWTKRHGFPAFLGVGRRLTSSKGLITRWAILRAAAQFEERRRLGKP